MLEQWADTHEVQEHFKIKNIKKRAAFDKNSQIKHRER
jgi:hypothetical protein